LQKETYSKSCRNRQLLLYVSAVAYHTSHQPTVEPLISSTGTVTTASTTASGCSSRAINSFAACSPITSLFWRTVVSWGLSVWVRGCRRIRPGKCPWECAAPAPGWPPGRRNRWYRWAAVCIFSIHYKINLCKPSITLTRLSDNGASLCPPCRSGPSPGCASRARCASARPPGIAPRCAPSRRPFRRTVCS